MRLCWLVLVVAGLYLEQMEVSVKSLILLRLCWQVLPFFERVKSRPSLSFQPACLKFSISKGGSSIRDFKGTLGKSGTFQQFFHVYGQENKNCSRISCRGKIKKIQIANRSSFYCSKCQS